MPFPIAKNNNFYKVALVVQKVSKSDFVVKQSIASLDNVKVVANQVGDSGILIVKRRYDSLVGMPLLVSFVVSVADKNNDVVKDLMLKNVFHYLKGNVNSYESLNGPG